MPDSSLNYKTGEVVRTTIVSVPRALYNHYQMCDNRNALAKLLNLAPWSFTMFPHDIYNLLVESCATNGVLADNNVYVFIDAEDWIDFTQDPPSKFG